MTTQFFTSQKTNIQLTLPSKTFLLGEYAALCGGTAYILTHTPIFKCAITTANQSFLKQNLNPPFALASPAGQFYTKHQLQNLKFDFYDPHQGRGGFGASSAQFVSAYAAVYDFKKINFKHLVQQYQQLHSHKGTFVPSAYDCVAQCASAATNKAFPQLVCVKNQGAQAFSQAWPFEEGECILIPTGLKVKTHEHVLRLCPDLWQADFLKQQKNFELDWQQALNSWPLLCEAVNRWACFLAQHKLVDPRAQQMLNKVRQQKYVQAAKACGALGADVICVLCQKMHSPQVLKNLAKLKLSGIQVVNKS